MIVVGRARSSTPKKRTEKKAKKLAQRKQKKKIEKIRLIFVIIGKSVHVKQAWFHAIPSFYPMIYLLWKCKNVHKKSPGYESNMLPFINYECTANKPFQRGFSSFQWNCSLFFDIQTHTHAMEVNHRYYVNISNTLLI